MVLRFRLRNTENRVAAIKAVLDAVSGLGLKEAKDGVDAGALDLPPDKLMAAVAALLPYADVGRLSPMSFTDAKARLANVCKRLLARPIQWMAEVLESLEQRL